MAENGRGRGLAGRAQGVILGAVLGATLLSCGGGAVAPSDPVAVPTPTPSPAGPPNLVLIVADDLGWGDLGAYGSTTIRTPHLDRLAAEGARLTQFTVPASLCAPSRAALMTGRYPVRTGVFWHPPRSLRPEERTLADVLKARGYATGAVGKWHLGEQEADLPLYHGFDFYYGMPYGEDEDNVYRGTRPTTDTVGLDQLARKYTTEAKAFMAGASRPFFLYLAHRSPHAPLAASDAFLGRSMGGLYGDMVEELDWSVGEVLAFLKEQGLERNTLVFFTSDNGPSRQGGVYGSAGPFLGAKAFCLEGGLRVPGLAWWPGRIRPGLVSDEIASTLDLLPTFAAAASAPLPTERGGIDGIDLLPLLSGAVSRLSGPGIGGGRELLHYYAATPSALRSGRYKYLEPGFWDGATNLFDLSLDPGETKNLYGERFDLSGQMVARKTELADMVASLAPFPR
jgi:arylsulfatase A-like enzyme